MRFSASDIIEQVKDELKSAWEDSKPSDSDGHEEGGFIVIDEFENLKVVRWEKGKQNEIVLPLHQNCKLFGFEIVASFHTHPNIGEDFQQEPSLTDVRSVRDDSGLKGENYVGEFVVANEFIYLVNPNGEYSEFGTRIEIFEE